MGSAPTWDAAAPARARCDVPSASPLLPSLPQAAGVPYQIDVIVEACDDSVAGVGQAICEKAEELGAAAVSSPSGGTWGRGMWG